MQGRRRCGRHDRSDAAWHRQWNRWDACRGQTLGEAGTPLAASRCDARTRLRGDPDGRSRQRRRRGDREDQTLVRQRTKANVFTFSRMRCCDRILLRNTQARWNGRVSDCPRTTLLSSPHRFAPSSANKSEPWRMAGFVWRKSSSPLLRSQGQNEHPQQTRIGFDRTISSEWLDAVIARVMAGETPEETRKFLWDFLEDVEPGTTNNSSRGKTLTVITRIWVSVPKQAEPLKQAALKCVTGLGERRIAVHWAMVAGTHPFFFDVATHVGKLVKLHGRANRSQIKRRMIEDWGDRSTLERTI